MPTARTTISIDKATLDRFFRAYPAGLDEAKSSSD